MAGSKSVLSSGNDAVLGPLGKIDPECTIACHAYLQILVVLGVFLSISQHVAINDVELDMWNRAFLIPFSQVSSKKFFVFTFEEDGHEPLVEKIRVQEGNLSRGIENRSWTILVGTRNG